MVRGSCTAPKYSNARYLTVLSRTGAYHPTSHAAARHSTAHSSGQKFTLQMRFRAVRSTRRLFCGEARLVRSGDPSRPSLKSVFDPILQGGS